MKKKNLKNKNLVELITSLEDELNVLIDYRKMWVEDFFRKYDGVDTAENVILAERYMKELKKVVSRRVGSVHIFKKLNSAVCPNCHSQNIKLVCSDCGADSSESLFDGELLEKKIFEGS